MTVQLEKVSLKHIEYDIEPISGDAYSESLLRIGG